MEVHPPEHGIHTWRDFFVHIGTICVGLLIAIGLEQSVEAWHHHHELVHLRAAMREDAEKNMREAETLNKDWVKRIMWLQGRVAQVQTALVQNKPLAPSAAEPGFTDGNYPSDPTWQSARASGTLSFMPEDEIKVYTEVDNWVSLIQPEFKDWDVAFRKRSGFELGFCGKVCGEGSFAGASAADLREYLRLLQDEIDAIYWDDASVHAVYNTAAALLRGERDLEKIQKGERGPMPGDELIH